MQGPRGVLAMPCYHPLSAYHILPQSGNGYKGEISFPEPKTNLQYTAINLPCGQCIGCRLERSRQWAMRCVHESQLYEKNCFITLTYNNDHLPDGGTLVVKHFQDFMKRLRKKYGEGIRFFHCGEYGEQTERPHYHAILFNHDFDDKKYWRTTKLKHTCYRSASLEQLWPFGNSEIGNVSFESAAYVARYIMKKVTGDDADLHYKVIDPSTGEIFQRKPEYTTMSRRPGIGKGWFDKFKTDVYPHDYVVIRGQKMRPPKFYDSQYEIIDPIEMEGIKFERYSKSLLHIDNNTLERLAVREQVQAARLTRLQRSL